MTSYGDYLPHTSPDIGGVYRELLENNAKEVLTALGRLDALNKIVYVMDKPHKFVDPDTGQAVDAFASSWRVEI